MKLLTPSRWRSLVADESKAQERKDAQDRRRNQPKASYRLRYTGPDAPLANGNRVHLVPLPGKDLHTHFTPSQIKRDICPTCQVVHPVKTHHLWIEPNNTVLVAQGVIDSINQDFPGGLEAADLVIDGGTDKPPPLTVGNGKPRGQQDQENSAIRQWSN